MLGWRIEQREERIQPLHVHVVEQQAHAHAALCRPQDLFVEQVPLLSRAR
jgi:hypothetical protein